MGRFLDFRDPYALAMKRHPLLCGRKILGRGYFSAVFEGRRANTVMKLTTDEVSYSLLNHPDFRVKHRHFPRVIENFGLVGTMSNHNLPLYLYEIERLKTTRGNARVLSWKIEDSQNNIRGRYNRDLGNERDYYVLRDMLGITSIPRPIRNALAMLADFVSNYQDAKLDMHENNFMQRSNGELVITDPLANRSLLLCG